MRHIHNFEELSLYDDWDGTVSCKCGAKMKASQYDFERNINFIPAVNFVKGRGNSKVKYIVLHCMDGYYKGTISWFQNKTSKVSAHFLISQQGEITQMVKEQDTAWHCFKLNQCSIGIEHEDLGHSDSTNWVRPDQYKASVNLSIMLCKKFGLTENDIVRHGEPWIVALGKAKGMAHPNCPGSNFPFEKYKEDVKNGLLLSTNS